MDNKLLMLSSLATTVDLQWQGPGLRVMQNC